MADVARGAVTPGGAGEVDQASEAAPPPPQQQQATPTEAAATTKTTAGHRRSRSAAEGSRDADAGSTASSRGRLHRSHRGTSGSAPTGDSVVSAAASVASSTRRHHHRSVSGSARASSSSSAGDIVNQLRFVGGVHAHLLSPGTVVTLALNILQHTLRSFSPEMLVVRRVVRRTHTTASSVRDDDDADELGSRHSSRRSGRRHGSPSSSPAGSTAPPVSPGADSADLPTARYPHRRHRSSSSEQRRRSGAESPAQSSSPSPQPASTADSGSGGPLSRRGRGSDVSRKRSSSAELLRRAQAPADAAAAPADGPAARDDGKPARRSRSDESRLSGNSSSAPGASATASASPRTRAASGNGSTAGAGASAASSANSSFGSHHSAGGLSALLARGSHASAPVAPGGVSSGSAGGATGLRGLPTPPPMIGKPPLSGRRLDGSTKDPRTPSSATSPMAMPTRPPLSPRAAAAAAAAAASEVDERSRRHAHRHHSSRDDGSVDGESTAAAAAAAAGEEEHGRRKQYSTTREWLHDCDVTRPAYLLSHVLRAGPVFFLHFVCGLKQQLVAAPMMRFADESTNAEELLRPMQSVLAAAAPDGDGDGDGGAAAAMSASSSSSSLWWGAHFVLARVTLSMLHRYIEDALFLDDSLVVRNLRSRRLSSRLVGWVMRLGSHAVLDPMLLSAISPILFLSVKDFSVGTHELKYTLPGVARGFCCGCAAFLVQSLVKPVVSQRINRAVITVLEATEYVLMRRYVVDWSNSDDEDDDEEMSDEHEDEHASETAGAGGEKSGDANIKTAAPSAAGTPAAVGEKSGGRAARNEARRQRRQQSSDRQRRREAAARQAIIRAILYRIAGGLAAQCLVEQPMSVLVELLRGRAVLHAVGLLSAYDAISPEDPHTAAHMLSWANLRALVASVTSAPAATTALPLPVRVLRQAGTDLGHEVNTISASITNTSGQAPLVDALVQRAAATRQESGGSPTARESAELLARSLLSMAPLFYGVQFAALDRLLSFYVAVWTRLMQQ